MKEIKTIKGAIYFLKEYRGFDIEDIKEYDYNIHDEDINQNMTTKEIIDYAKDQLISYNESL